MGIRERYTEKFKELLIEGEIVSRSESTDDHDYGVGEHVDRSKFVEWRTKVVTLLSEILPIKSPLRKTCERYLELMHTKRVCDDIFAMLHGCRKDFEDGMFDDLEKRVEADVSVNYLEQAERLMRDKDGADHTYIAAAVLAGAVLEKALRTLCKKASPPIPVNKVGGQAKTLNPLIDDLKKANVFNEIEAKQLRTWADIRNAAAHGRFEEFDRAQVEAMLVDVQRFLGAYMK